MNCNDCPFTWSDLTAFNFENWRDGEPNNVDGKENCVEIYSGNPDGEWVLGLFLYSHLTLDSKLFIIDLKNDNVCT